MSAELIYKTTSPKAIGWWMDVDAEQEKAHERRRAFVASATEAFGPTPKYDGFHPNRELMVSRERVVGLAAGSHEQPPADSGWRLDASEGFWKPKLATTAGKARAKELDALASYPVDSHLSEIGVPAIAFAGNYLYRAGIRFRDGALYQVWGSGSCMKECEAVQAKVPEVIWEEVARSKWYAMVEAEEEARQLSSSSETP